MTDIVIPYRTGRIAVLADFHLDHWRRAGGNPLDDLQLVDLLRSDLDALIIAGDLINGPPGNWTRAFDYLSAYIAPSRIYIFPGNHDYYQSSLAADPAMAAVASAKGAHFVQMRVLRHGMTRFLCATLWTDYDLLGDRKDAMYVAAQIMNDHRSIALGNPAASESYEALLPPPIDRLVTAGDLRAVHVQHRKWLEGELAKAHPDGSPGQTVVVTHHGPHPSVCGPVDRLTPAFHSDLTVMLSSYAIDCWVFGHSHRQLRSLVEGCDIRNVSIGYPDERHDHPDYLIEASLWESRNGPQ